jgi:hypothetical protein
MYTVAVKSSTQGIFAFIINADAPNATAVPGYLAFYLASTGALVALIPNEMLAYATVTPPGAAGSVA